MPFQRKVTWGNLDAASVSGPLITVHNELDRTIEIDGVFWGTGVYMLTAPSEAIASADIVGGCLELRFIES